MSTSDYKPVSCAVYDQLELAIMQKRSISCTIKSVDGAKPRTTELHIIDLYTRDGAEFMKLKDGSEIRLDFVELL